MKLGKEKDKLRCPKCGFVGIPNVKTIGLKAAYCSHCDAYITNLPMNRKQKEKGK